MLRALAAAGQSPVAAALDLSESSITRMKDGDLKRFSMFLAAIGLKVVPTTAKLVDEQMVEALLTLARDRLANLNLDDWINQD